MPQERDFSGGKAVNSRTLTNWDRGAALWLTKNRAVYTGRKCTHGWNECLSVFSELYTVCARAVHTKYRCTYEGKSTIVVT